MTPRMWLTGALAVVLVVGAVALADATDANAAATLLAIIVSTVVGAVLFADSTEPH